METGLATVIGFLVGFLIRPALRVFWYWFRPVVGDSINIGSRERRQWLCKGE